MLQKNIYELMPGLRRFTIGFLHAEGVKEKRGKKEAKNAKELLQKCVHKDCTVIYR